MAVQQNPHSIQYAIDTYKVNLFLKQSSKIAELGLTKDGTSLQHYASNIRNDDYLVRLAVENNYLALKFAPPIFRNL